MAFDTLSNAETLQEEFFEKMNPILHLRVAAENEKRKKGEIRRLASLRRRFRQIFSKSWEREVLAMNVDPCENEKNRTKQRDHTKNFLRSGTLQFFSHVKIGAAGNGRP